MNIKFISQRWFHYIVFSGITVLILFIFLYARLINEPPQSIHYWRQSDSYSIALNYYNHGMHFLQPEVHNHNADHFSSGKTISECPYMYYAVAAAFNIFGPHFWVYRLIWSLITLLAFLTLYKILLVFNVPRIAAGMASILILSSPFFIYYGNSFIPDIPAITMILLAWLNLFLYRKNKRNINLVLVFTLFAMAGLIKITALMSYFALGAAFILELFGLKFGLNGEKLFPLIKRTFLYFFLVIVVIALWYLYARHYNIKHSASYFSMTTWPIWNYSGCETATIPQILNHIRTYWLPYFFNVPMLSLIFVSIVFIGFEFKKADKLLVLITILLFFACASLFVLYFGALNQHDYYFIMMYILPVFILITAIDILTKIKIEKKYLYFIITILFSVTCYQIHYTRKMQKERYYGWVNETPKVFKELIEIRNNLAEIGIPENAKVISVPDYAPSYTLSLINRPGYSLYEKIYDSLAMNDFVRNGAEYLIISDFNKSVSELPYLLSYPKDSVFAQGQMRIYKLHKPGE